MKIKKNTIIPMLILVIITILSATVLSIQIGGTSDCSEKVDCTNIVDGKTCNDVTCQSGYQCVMAGGECYCANSNGCEDISCQDDCSIASQRCSGNDIQICEDFNGDSCYEWGFSQTCPVACSNGQCTNTPPTQDETCNGIDDDNDETTDNTQNNYYCDADLDGYGEKLVCGQNVRKGEKSFTECETDCINQNNDQDCSTENQEPLFIVQNENDCNDTDKTINPDAQEICGNEIDENCDETTSTCGKGDGLVTILENTKITFEKEVEKKNFELTNKNSIGKYESYIDSNKEVQPVKIIYRK